MQNAVEKSKQTDLQEEIQKLQVANTAENQQNTPISTALIENAEGTSYINLRSRKVVKGTLDAVDLSEYLSTFYEQARKSNVITEEHCKDLEKKIVKARDLRREKISKFKSDTEDFLKHLRDFRGFSCSPTKNNKTKCEKVNEDISLSESDFAIAWLESSLLEISNPDSPSNNTKSFIETDIMADYEKVSKLTAQMVPIFSGEPGPNLVNDLHTFIGCCRQVRKCLSSQDLPAFLQICITRLRGHAYQLLSMSTVTTFEEVEKVLNNAYLPRETYQEAINKLITCRQFPLETFCSFANRVKQTLEHCKEIAESKYGETGLKAMKQQLEDFAIAAIKSGSTNPHLSMYLLALSETSLDKVVQKALDMEKLQQGSPYLQPGDTFQQLTNVASFQNQQFPNPAFRNEQLPNSTVQNQHSNSINSNISQNIPTYNTFSSNHQYTALAQNQTPIHPTYPVQSEKYNTLPSQSNINYQNHDNIRTVPNSSNSTILARIICSYCKAKGHTYDDCLKRKNTPFCIQCKTNGHDVKYCKSSTFRKPLGNNGKQSGNFGNVNSTNNGVRLYNINKICEFCGRRGHDLTECRQKQKWESRKSGNDYQSTGNPSVRL